MGLVCGGRGWVQGGRCADENVSHVFVRLRICSTVVVDLIIQYRRASLELRAALEELNNLDQNGAPWPSMASHGTLPRNPDGEHAAKQE